MTVTLKLALVISILGGCYAEECCDAYFNTLGEYVDPQYCEHYCCGTLLTGLTCCNEVLLQADYDDRSDYCYIWWTHHVWALIIIGVVFLLSIACCCFCCYRCCCRNTTTIVYQPGMITQGGGMQVSQISTSQQQSSMGSYSYDQSPKY